MKQFLPIFFLFLFVSSSYGQSDSISLPRQVSKGYAPDNTGVNISIYPVPVREKSFTIKSDKEISSIKITNIIGQDIFIEKYNTPLFITKIILENAKRGMYLVAITFSDNTRSVRRILVEGAL
jgi:hypothetical protein